MYFTLIFCFSTCIRMSGLSKPVIKQSYDYLQNLHRGPALSVLSTEVSHIWRRMIYPCFLSDLEKWSVAMATYVGYSWCRNKTGRRKPARVMDATTSSWYRNCVSSMVPFQPDCFLPNWIAKEWMKNLITVLSPDVGTTLRYRCRSCQPDSVTVKSDITKTFDLLLRLLLDSILQG